MRTTFLVMLLLNLVLLAWGQGYFGGRDAGRESERLGRQLQPENLRIIAAAPPAIEAVTCKRIEGLVPSMAAEVHKLLGALPGWQSEIKTSRESTPYQVMIPELAGPTAAHRKLGELRRLGIEEGQIIENAKGTFSLPLDSFADMRAADDYLQSLIAKGVRSARIVPGETSERAHIEVRAPAADVARKLEEVLAPMRPHKLTDCTAP